MRPRLLLHRWICAQVLALPLLLTTGCEQPPSPSKKTPESTTTTAATSEDAAPEPVPAAASAEELLEMRLPLEETRQGWVRLFDGRTLIGWQASDQVDWKVERLAVQATKGDIALLCTTTEWKDFELQLEFNVDADTNSGIFLRTPLFGTDPETNCYEFNIAPADNPFPTGSIVKRHRVEPSAVGELEPGKWHKLRLIMEGGKILAEINGKQVLDWEDPNEPLKPNLIGLQHNSGRAAFRDIRLMPLGWKSLLEEPELAQWKTYPEMGGKFVMEEDKTLHITGGKGQLESKEEWSDFALLTEVKTNAKDLNGGLFFRCIPGETMNGYECQICNATIDGNPLLPKDCGTGGIFRRLNARIVAAEDLQWATVMVHARGPHIATWVNGLQVVDWVDTREPDPNPRKGLRTEAGTLMLQAHDETTDYSFAQIKISPIP